MYLGACYDALRMIIGDRANSRYINIKPSAGYDGSLLVGPAFTTYGEVVTGPEFDNTTYQELDNIRMEIYRDFQDYFSKFRPIVCLQSNDSLVAHTGDITSMIYKKMGAVGMLTDGITRDANIIDEIGFPLFSKDVNPIDAIDHWAITGYNEPIEVEGVEIHPGDTICMDKDGALVVPQVHAEEFMANFANVVKREARVRLKISSGENLDDILDEMGRW